MPDHVPPLGLHALTGLYDRVMALTMPEARFRTRIVALAEPRPGEQVLDLGCGTGELALALKAAHPDVDVVALDPDAPALDIARSKFAAAGIDVRVVHGMSDVTDLEAASFDVVVSSLVLHHLARDAKETVLGDALRLLRPRGRVVVGDWGEARSWAESARFLPVRVLDGFAVTEDNTRGRLPDMFREAGFGDVFEHERVATVFGPLAIYAARRPE